MRCWVIALACVLLWPMRSDAQVSTADGVRALAAGDVALAFRILEPLAEGSSPDPMAQFFLGAMYWTGSGVESDPILACGLYKRAAAASHPMISEPARALAEDFLNRASPIARDMCELARTAPRENPLPALPDPALVRRLSVDATADGIEAFVRGDYSKAADVFRPLAENWPGGADETASFFMGLLYEYGFGVIRDPVRACALYSRIEPSRRFYGRLVPEALMAGVDMPTERFADCNMLSFIGFDHGFQRATFTLAPGHWIDIDIAGRVTGALATVAYQGRSEQSELPTMPSPGVRYLPIEYTPLDVRGRAPGRRHFLQVANWTRHLPVREWQLTWFLFEVVRGELVSITDQVLLTAPDGPRPEGDVDLGTLVTLRVNGQGIAEWAVLTGEKPTAAIETDAERQEMTRDMEELRAQKARREAAGKRVDWSQVRDVNRDPSLTFVDSEGCRNLTLYGWSADRMEAVVIRADKQALGLTAGSGVFALAGQKQIEVWVEVFSRPGGFDYCSDIHSGEPRLKESWRAVGGTASIQLSEPGVRREPRLYKVWIQIDGAEFVGPSGRRVRANIPIHLMGTAGNCVGGCISPP